jgi:dTDP-4-amino-4,6-dideoxygalactose transaminase
MARLERALMNPRLFSLTVFPVLWGASYFSARPDVYLWEKVRPLSTFQPGYRERYSNVQAALGLAGLDRLDEWTHETRAHAAAMTQALAGLPGVDPPPAPADRVHVYYQYCLYVPDRDRAVTRCLRSGLDVEYHHMDVCPDLPLFEVPRAPFPGARRTADALQVPVHAGLRARDFDLVSRRLRGALDPTARAGSEAAGLPM